MKKRSYTINFVLLLFMTLNFGILAQARTLESFSGRIKNFSTESLPTSSIKINIAWHQWKSGLLGFKKTIKSGKFDVKIDSNGTFSVPSVNMGLGHHHKLTLTIELPQDSEIKGWPESIRFTDYEDKEINQLQEDLKIISIYRLPAMALPIALTSNANSQDWFLDQGLETKALVNLKFEGARPSPYATDDTIYFKNEFYPSLTQEALPARYYIINGDLEANANVKIDIELRNYALKKGLIGENHYSTNLNSIIPLKTIAIDDSQFPSLERNIDGNYNSLVTINELSTHTWDMFDGTFSIHCNQDGVLSGQLTGKPRGGNKNQVYLDVPVTGTCDGFTAEVTFNINLPSHKKTETLTGKILGVVHQGNGVKSLRGDYTSITGKDTVFTDLGFRGEFSEARMEIN